ncbi:UNVERIFIED_CONTAM: hypothetical protein GTU68_004335 [Idotea baltica]|nr:hypothetical protein [Idotea baltica]
MDVRALNISSTAAMTADVAPLHSRYLFSATSENVPRDKDIEQVFHLWFSSCSKVKTIVVLCLCLCAMSLLFHYYYFSTSFDKCMRKGRNEGRDGVKRQI